MLELLAKRIQSSEPGFSTKYVRWAIVFNSKTGFTGVVELGQPEQKRNLGKEFKHCPEMDRGLLQAGGKSHFLVETANVVAMYKVEETDTKTFEKHQFFVSMLSEAGQDIPQLATIARFIRDEDTLIRIKQAMERNKVKPTDKVTFQLDGQFPVETDCWHNWWRSFHRSLKETKLKKAKTGVFRCFATGELVTPERTHPKIKGLGKVGGLTSGDVLIGFDKKAFCSYGLEQSANAAVSAEAARTYTSSLNELITNSGQKLAGSIVVHWFKEKVKDEDDPLAFLTGTPEVEELNAQEKARRLLRSLETGERPDLAGNRYYILTMSGAAGRVMVRDWLEGDFQELARNITQWFDDLSIVSFASPSRPAPSPKLESVVTCVLPKLKRGSSYNDWVRPVGAVRVELLRAAIQNLPIPYEVLSRLIPVHRSFIFSEEWQNILQGQPGKSIALDYSILHTRIALIRAYHLRKYRKEGSKLAEMLTPKLNKEFPHVAYQCGRLMAALAELQHAALGDVGAGVVQRYYTAASTTPALVLGRLTSNSQHHLNKLNAGLARRYEDKIAEIWSHITEPLPKTLTLEEQSLFALGYYHQLASFRAGKLESERQEKED